MTKKSTGRPPKSIAEYIVEDRGYETPCWVWQRSLVMGYGSLRIARKTYYAHRVYWERENGPIPEGLDLDHLCRVRACCNPAHTEPVTRAENLRRGCRTKLNQESVRDIRTRYAAGGILQRELATEYGVSPITIGSVLARRSWKDVF